MNRAAFLIAVGVVTLTGAFLRFSQADTLPAGLEYDEGLQGLDAAAVWAGNFAIYFREAYREPLYVYLAAPFVGLLGQTAFAIRVPAMIAGTVTIPITAGLVADLFGDSLGPRRARLVGLLAAGLIAVSLWPIIMSRTGIPGTILPPIAAGVIWLFGRAMRSGTGWLPAGLMLGLAPYTYLPSRLLPLVIGSTLLVDAVQRRQSSVLAKHWPGVSRAAIASLVVFAPLGLYYLSDPVGLIGRASHVSVFRPTVPEGNAGLAILRTTSQSVAAFLWSGDTNWYHNLPGRPIFDPVVAILTAVGFIILLARSSRLPFLQLTIWLAAMSLPGILSDDNNPNTARMVGLIPIAFLLPALGLDGALTMARATVGAIRTRGTSTRPEALAQSLSFARMQDDQRSTLSVQRLTVFSVGIAFAILANSASLTVAAWETWSAAPEAYLARSGESVDVVRIMNERAGSPGMLFLLPISNSWPVSRNYQQRSFQYLYRGPAPYAFHRVDDLETPEALDVICNRCRQVMTVVWKTGPHIDSDPKGLVPALLGQAGLLTMEEQRPGYDLLTYSLPERPRFRTGPLQARRESTDGRLLLTGVSAEQSWSGRAISLATRWRLAQSSRSAERLSYRLVETEGGTVAQIDRPLLSNQHRDTTDWEVGDEEIDRALLPIPPGTPPGSYRLTTVIYGGGPEVSLELGSVELTRPFVRYEPFELDLDIELSDNHPAQRAVGVFFGPDTVAEGRSVELTLYWQAGERPAAVRYPRLVLVGLDGRLVAESRLPAGPARYPPDQWHPGEIVAQRLILPLSSAVSAGRYRLEVWVDSNRIAERPIRIG